MPIYEYACTSCDHRADLLLGINDPGPHFCPSCGEEGTMRKLFAPPTVHYKGSGWAKKDRGGSSAASRTPAASGSSETEGKKSDTEKPPTSTTSATPSDAGSSSSSSAD